MKLKLIKTSFILLLFFCACTNQKDAPINHKKLNNLHNSLSCPSVEEQKYLFDQFAQLCYTDGYVAAYIFSKMAEYSSSMYTLPESVIWPDSVLTTTLLDVTCNDASDFLNLIDCYCTPNNVHFNIYTPHIPISYSHGDPIYIVNALNIDDLDADIIGYDSVNSPILKYAALKVNSSEISDTVVTYAFSQTHPVIALTFRDQITEWNHLAKGEQSFSDTQIITSVSYEGYGCIDGYQLYENMYEARESIIFPILHSVTVFKKPCDERYDHFCKLGRPQALEYNHLDDFTIDTDFDPYMTSWSIIDMTELEQDVYVYITQNIDDIDLRGHDFWIQDTTIFCDSCYLHVPRQICTYNETLNAQQFRV